MADDKTEESSSELAGRLLAIEVVIGVVLKHNPWRTAVLADALAILDQIKPGANDLLDTDEAVLTAARRSLERIRAHSVLRRSRGSSA